MSWHSFLFSNLKAKIAILLMAAFLWFFVVTSKEYIHALHVPLRTVNLPADMVFLQAPPPSAEVRFRGRGTSLIFLALFGDAYIGLDLSAAQTSQLFQLTADQVHWAPTIEVQVLEIVPPDTVRILLGEKQKAKSP